MPITSKEVRKLAIKACQSGKFKQNDLAELFEVSTSTLSKWVKIFKESQRESPRDRGHRANHIFQNVCRSLYLKSQQKQECNDKISKMPGE